MDPALRARLAARVPLLAARGTPGRLIEVRAACGHRRPQERVGSAMPRILSRRYVNGVHLTVGG
jgi:hypothetical protein